MQTAAVAARNLRMVVSFDGESRGHMFAVMAPVALPLLLWCRLRLYLRSATENRYTPLKQAALFLVI
jgi:hypothetical protein